MEAVRVQLDHTALRLPDVEQALTAEAERELLERLCGAGVGWCGELFQVLRESLHIADEHRILSADASRRSCSSKVDLDELIAEIDSRLDASQKLMLAQRFGSTHWHRVERERTLLRDEVLELRAARERHLMNVGCESASEPGSWVAPESSVFLKRDLRGTRSCVELCKSCVAHL